MTRLRVRLSARPRAMPEYELASVHAGARFLWPEPAHRVTYVGRGRGSDRVRGLSFAGMDCHQLGGDCHQLG